MNYWIRCDNCGKVGRFSYPSDIVGDADANQVVHANVKDAGWVYADKHNFCCETCEKEWEEHLERTGNALNLPAVYARQQQGIVLDKVQVKHLLEYYTASSNILRKLETYHKELYNELCKDDTLPTVSLFGWFRFIKSLENYVQEGEED